MFGYPGGELESSFFLMLEGTDRRELVFLVLDGLKMCPFRIAVLPCLFYLVFDWMCHSS